MSKSLLLFIVIIISKLDLEVSVSNIPHVDSLAYLIYNLFVCLYDQISAAGCSCLGSSSTMWSPGFPNLTQEQNRRTK